MTVADTERPAGLPENFRTVAALAETYGEAQRKITRQALELKSLRADVARLESEIAVARIELAQRPTQTDPVADEPWRIEDQAAWLVAAANRTGEGSY